MAGEAAIRAVCVRRTKLDQESMPSPNRFRVTAVRCWAHHFARFHARRSCTYLLHTHSKGRSERDPGGSRCTGGTYPKYASLFVDSWPALFLWFSHLLWPSDEAHPTLGPHSLELWPFCAHNWLETSRSRGGPSATDEHRGAQSVSTPSHSLLPIGGAAILGCSQDGHTTHRFCPPPEHLATHCHSTGYFHSTRWDNEFKRDGACWPRAVSIASSE